jgi:diguanylate cyclase (GGDEF)-like protein
MARGKRGSGYTGWPLVWGAIGNLLLIAVMITIVWGSIWLHLEQQREQAAAQAALNSGNLARVAAESIGATIANLDHELRFLRDVNNRDPQRFDISTWASQINKTQPTAFEFVMTNRDGLLTASSLGAVTGAYSVSGQPFFQAQRDSAQDQLFISQPIFGQSSHRWSILFSRKLSAADGWFTGIIAAAADAAWLTHLHQDLDIGHGSLLLVGSDGVVRGMTDMGDAVAGAGQDITASALINAAKAAPQGSLGWDNPINRVQQIASFRRIDGYPLVVAIGLDSNEVFAPYRSLVRQYEIFGGCLTAFILLTGCLLLAGTRRLLESRQTLRDSVDAISEGIIMVDGRGRIPVINRRAAELLRLPARLVHGRPTLQSIAKWEQLKQGSAGTSHLEDGLCSHCIEERPDGTILEIHNYPLADGREVRTYADITERKRAEAEIVHLAHHDSLTGVANRTLLTGSLRRATHLVQESGIACAVLRIDLDGFKHINDLHGHATGDALLCQIAARLCSVVAKADVVARLDGDEFCILQAASEQPAASEQLAARLMDLLCVPFQIGGQEILLSACVGAALCPTHGSSPDVLLTNADTALACAKHMGENTFKIYEPTMDQKTFERRQLEQDLRSALENNELLLYYQPVFDSITCEPVGFEALVRWNHPERGRISPEDFVPVAEESGLIIGLSRWAMETACASAQLWPEPLRIAVNVSPKLFLDSNLARRIMAILDVSGLDPSRLVIEVTEGVIIDHSDRAMRTMTALKKIGVRISLDDFGIGYSSLSYLHQFEFDSLKIDRSFVRGLPDDSGSQAIVQAILALGRSLNLKVIAEGVETRPQLRWLRNAGCAEIQGFLLGRPMSAAAAREFMTRSIAIAESDQQRNRA